MSDLDTLRPEVRDALFSVGKRCDAQTFDTLSAELLRLAEDAAMFAHAVSLGQRYKQRAETAEAELAEARKNETVALGLWNAAEGRATKAEAELAEARETIKRLNRRVQVAEAGVAEKVKASAPGSLGRALANAAAHKYMRERDMAQAELAALKARIAEAPEYRCEADIISGRDGDYISAVLIHDDNAFQYPDVDGKRVRLLVEE